MFTDPPAFVRKQIFVPGSPFGCCVVAPWVIQTSPGCLLTALSVEFGVPWDFVPNTLGGNLANSLGFKTQSSKIREAVTLNYAHHPGQWTAMGHIIILWHCYFGDRASASKRTFS